MPDPPQALTSNCTKPPTSAGKSALAGNERTDVNVHGRTYPVARVNAAWAPVRSSKGDYYWFNKITRESSWQTPAGYSPVSAEGHLGREKAAIGKDTGVSRRVSAGEGANQSPPTSAIEQESRTNGARGHAARAASEWDPRRLPPGVKRRKPLKEKEGSPMVDVKPEIAPVKTEPTDPVTHVEPVQQAVQAEPAPPVAEARQLQQTDCPAVPAEPEQALEGCVAGVGSSDMDLDEQHEALPEMIPRSVKQMPDADAGLYEPYNTLWSPSSLFDPRVTRRRYFIVMLNQHVWDAHALSFERLWSRASVRLCADGAANRLYDMFRGRGFIPVSQVSEGPHRVGINKMLPPDEIIGDLDSVREEVKQFFVDLGTLVVHRPSQYATDLQKSLQRIEDLEDEFLLETRRDVVVYGGLSGRFDQTNHTLHVLWQLAAGVPVLEGVYDPNPEGEDAQRGGLLQKRAHTYVVNDDSVVWLLPRGKHTLQLDRRLLGKTCGILPLGISMQGGGSRVSTMGLEWDLTADMTTHLGGLLSTSNHLVGDGTVHLETDTPIFWSVELKSDEEITKEVRKAREAAKANRESS